ncbi:MAG: hypothetical protein V2A73_12765 [Pseudomonadota bacterium]
MGGPTRVRAAIKFLFWVAASTGVVGLVVHSFRSGQMTGWYYHRSSVDGYAIDADGIGEATKEHPVVLGIGDFAQIDGLQAVPVKKGQRLPRNANGVIAETILKEGRRATLEENQIVVRIPWEVKQAKGFKFKDTFKHKGVKTNPWSAPWNVGIVFALGICLGFMAEGFTDLLGMRIQKIKHFEGH